MATIVLAFYIWGAHWSHLGNMTEPCMCGGDAALCQITLTTCCIFVILYCAICNLMSDYDVFLGD